MVKHAASVAIVVLMCLVKSSALSQIPNASFESWTNGDPDGYVTSNINGIVTNVTQSTVAHTGSSAVRGDVVQFFTQVLQPVIQSGPGGHGFGYNQRPGSFTGWYQFTGVGGDRFAVNVGLYQGGINGTIIAIAAAAPSTQVTSYTQITAPFVYQNPGLPDTCIVQVQIVGPSVSVPPHVASFFLLDDVALVGSAGVEQGTPAVPLAASLEQNYPNPFNPGTRIQYSLPSQSSEYAEGRVGVGSLVTLKVFDVLGREVATLVNEEKKPGTYEVSFDASSLPSGVYYYRLQSGNFVDTKKLTVLK